MKTKRKFQILILAFGFFSFTGALADEVRLKNGDRITGEIVRMERKKLIIEEAQMTIETEEPEKPLVLSPMDVTALSAMAKRPVKIRARANAGLISERGNSNSDSARVDASFLARTLKSRYTVAGELNRERAEGRDTANNWLAYGNYDYFFKPKWFWYSRAQFEHDEFEN